MERLFVGFKLPHQEIYSGLIAPLQKKLHYENIRWTRPENIHCTLWFIGSIKPDELKNIFSALETAAKQTMPFTVFSGGIGVFGSCYQPRVLWLGITPPSPLLELNRNIEKAFIPLGILRDRQNFVPHISLGRMKSIKDKQAFLSLIESTPPINKPASFTVSSISLFESILLKEGPEYIELQKFNFIN